MNIIFPVFCVVSCMAMVISAPLSSCTRILLVPASAFSNLPYGQTRGPFDFIGNWIQSSNIFPIEINIPDTFQAVGNGVGSVATNVGNFAQGVGSNIQGFVQTVGGGVQSFAQNLGQRLPILGAFIRPNQTSQKYFIVVPDGQSVERHGGGNGVVMVSDDLDSEILDSFP